MDIFLYKNGEAGVKITICHEGGPACKTCFELPPGENNVILTGKDYEESGEKSSRQIRVAKFAGKFLELLKAVFGFTKSVIELIRIAVSVPQNWF